MRSRHRSSIALFTMLLAPTVSRATSRPPVAVSASLTEWKIGLSQRTISAGEATFTIRNDGQIPHAFEVEGRGI